MKLRCANNSIRIRVRKSELVQLKENKRIEEKIWFGNQNALTFALRINESIHSVQATLSDNRLIINLPEDDAEKWIISDQIGIEVRNPVADDHFLHILIEKDFPCSDRPEEDISDTFWELTPDSPDAC